MADDPFQLVVTDLCPPDQVYVLDPGAIWPSLDEIQGIEIDPEQKVILCPDERTAERIREAAKRVGRIDLGAWPHPITGEEAAG